MQTFTVRGKDGTMVAKIGGPMALGVITQTKGHWRDYKTKDGMTQCFEVEEDCKFSMVNHNSNMEIFFWDGYKIVQDI